MIYFRRCIRITADDSPNVIAGKAGNKDHETVPGVVTWEDYLHHRKVWDIQQQTEGLDAQWYVGPALKLVPKQWWEAATKYVASRPPYSHPRWLGCDPGEGGDDTAWVVIDRYGILHILSTKTPDTNKVVGQTIELVRQFDVPWENVVFDRGGGGKEHADRLRASGYNVRTVDFGTIKKEPKRSMILFPEKREMVEDKAAAVNRRSQMYYDIRLLLERDSEGGYVPRVQRGCEGFAVPMPLCTELVRQIDVVDLDWDAEGRFKLMPKQNPTDPEDQKTFRYRLGRSPDVADAFALAVFGMVNKPITARAGAT